MAVNTTDGNRRVKQEVIVQEQHLSLQHIAFLQAHELRSPVANILGLMNLIETNNFNDSEIELTQLANAVRELDDKIKLIIDEVSSVRNESS